MHDVTRTLACAHTHTHAGAGKDHLVGWANSSLRFMHQLPTLPPAAASAKGVVLEDPLLSAFDTRCAHKYTHVGMHGVLFVIGVCNSSDGGVGGGGGVGVGLELGLGLAVVCCMHKRLRMHMCACLQV
jgi:hypothetical protein